MSHGKDNMGILPMLFYLDQTKPYQTIPKDPKRKGGMMIMGAINAIISVISFLGKLDQTVVNGAGFPNFNKTGKKIRYL